jgi:hypothetical protein
MKTNLVAARRPGPLDVEERDGSAEIVQSGPPPDPNSRCRRDPCQDVSALMLALPSPLPLGQLVEADVAAFG